MAQSADIHARLSAEGVRIVSGQGRLSDEIRGLAAHQRRGARQRGAVTEELESDVVLHRDRRRPAGAGRRRARRRADPRLARRLRARGDARAPRGHRLRRHGGRVRLRLPGGRGAGHAGLLPRPGAARRGRRRGRRRRAGVPVPRWPDRRARPRRRGEADREGRHRRAHRRPHRRGLARSDDRRHRAEHLRAEPRAVRGRGDPVRPHRRRPGLPHLRAGHLRRRRRHRGLPARLGRGDAGPHRDVARPRRGRRADQAQDGRRQRLHPPRDRHGRRPGEDDRRRPRTSTSSGCPWRPTPAPR